MNKPRLIDANELLKVMEKRYRQIEKKEEFHTSDEFYGIAKGFGEVDILINNQPTAYNIDGVVEQLEDEMEFYEQMEDSFLALGYRSAYKKAIEIVRKGGAVDD